METNISARKALTALQEGNCRFTTGTSNHNSFMRQNHHQDLVAGQKPFAVILGCSDSRVPVEMIFDQGFGDLFVIRVAGNVVAPSQIGSVEFAAEQFGTRLVVVLGHSGCGAIEATLEELQHGKTSRSQNLRSIVDRIRPSIEELCSTELVADKEKLMHRAVRAHVRVSANALRNSSEILEQLIKKDELLVIGAEYSLETGEVDFFDGMEDTD